MPLRTDPTLWFNLPGIVAAWQPVRAPGSLLARYNQAHGGDNRYKATDGTAPSWSGALGWVFNGSSTYLKTGVVPDDIGTLAIKFSGAALTGDNVTIGSRSSGSVGMFIQNSNSTNRVYVNGAFKSVSPYITTGVMAISNNKAYLNGILEAGDISTSPYSITYEIYVGCLNNGGSPAIYRAANVQAVVYYNRALSAAEMWTISRQMAYCDVNPDWSAWGRRRKWFYLAPTAGSSYDDAASLGRTDAISQLANLVIDVEISGYGVFAESVGLSRLAGVSESGLLELAGLLSLGRTAGVDLAGLLELSGSLSLGRLAGLDASSLAVLGETISLGREAGISASAGAAIIEAALSLARNAGISETAIQVMVGEITLAREARIDLTSLGQFVESLLLGYTLAETQTGTMPVFGELSLGKWLSVTEVAQVIAWVITAITRIYRVPPEWRCYAPIDQRAWTVDVNRRLINPVYDRSYLVPIDRRVLEAV